MGAKKKEIKTVSTSSLATGAKIQAIDKIFVPATSKQTEVIEGELNQVAGRIVDIMKSEIKVI
jgi:electron transfer flavoprotein alpha/beta subunit